MCGVYLNLCRQMYPSRGLECRYMAMSAKPNFSRGRNGGTARGGGRSSSSRGSRTNSSSSRTNGSSSSSSSSSSRTDGTSNSSTGKGFGEAQIHTSRSEVNASNDDTSPVDGRKEILFEREQVIQACVQTSVIMVVFGLGLHAASPLFSPAAHGDDLEAFNLYYNSGRFLVFSTFVLLIHAVCI